MINFDIVKIIKSPIYWYLSVSSLIFLVLTSATSAQDSSSNDFLANHWQRPLQHQGEPPDTFSKLEASLDPKACGSCHPLQFQDWQNSLHAHAMGPGILGQLMDMDFTDKAELQSCLSCHAPLAEQTDELIAWLSNEETDTENLTENIVPIGSIFNQGLICAGCHMRNYQLYGPPKSEEKTNSTPEKENTHKPHNGWQVESSFESSKFCAACHQFEDDGYALNGKLIENTFNEWRVSPQAKAGKTCQSCHMPDRRHLWLGIHDKATTLSGVKIELHKVITSSKSISGILTMTNTKVGHQFPTYVTPRVIMSAHQQDEKKQQLPGTRQEVVVARQVSLDLSEELFDTRLAPGQTARLRYEAFLHPRTKSLLFQIRVEPDYFYTNFYRKTLASYPNLKGIEKLQEALRNAEASNYILFISEIAIDN